MRTVLQMEAERFANSVRLSPDVPVYWAKCIRTALELGYTAGVNETIRQMAQRPTLRVGNNDGNPNPAA